MGGVDDNVFADGLGDGLLDLLPCGMVREGCVRIRDVLVGDHAALVGDGLEGKRAVGNGDFRVAATVIPAKFLDEKRSEIKVLQMLPDLAPVEGGRHSQAPSWPIRPSEQMILGS